MSREGDGFAVYRAEEDLKRREQCLEVKTEVSVWTQLAWDAYWRSK